MEPVDLEAAARARAETLAEGGPVYEFRGITFTFPPVGDVAWSVLEQLDTHLSTGLDALLDGQAETFWEAKPTVVEVVTLKEELLKTYAGLLAGESGASRASSKRSTKRSRPPSPTRTPAKPRSAS